MSLNVALLLSKSGYSSESVINLKPIDEWFDRVRSTFSPNKIYLILAWVPSRLLNTRYCCAMTLRCKNSYSIPYSGNGRIPFLATK